MSKSSIQRQMIKTLAFAPWVYTKKSLASELGISLSTLSRYLSEMESRGYVFAQDQGGNLFLQTTGWEGLQVKDATLRQMEILRFISAHSNGVKVAEINARFNHLKDDKTIGRDLKELQKKGLIFCQQDKYLVNDSYGLPPLQLDEMEKRLLYEQMTVQKEMSPLKKEAKSFSAKLRVSMKLPEVGQEIIVVHGRRPIDDLRRSNFCQRLEDCARESRRILILYRKNSEQAQEAKLNPLGIMYYWPLDNWYLVAQDCNDKQYVKTYAVERILTIDELQETFSYPAGFNMEDWFKSTWGVYRSGKPVKVVIRFHPYYSTITRAKAELGSRIICRLTEDDKGLLMEAEVDGLAEMAVWLRSFGQGAEVLEPPELREAVVQDLKQMLENYGG